MSKGDLHAFQADAQVTQTSPKVARVTQKRYQDFADGSWNPWCVSRTLPRLGIVSNIEFGHETYRHMLFLPVYIWSTIRPAPREKAWWMFESQNCPFSISEINHQCCTHGGPWSILESHNKGTRVSWDEAIRPSLHWDEEWSIAWGTVKTIYIRSAHHTTRAEYEVGAAETIIQKLCMKLPPISNGQCNPVQGAWVMQAHNKHICDRIHTTDTIQNDLF